MAKPGVFVEPFAGGGIVGLTVAFERLAERVVLVELDRDVAAVWQAILNGCCERLVDRIRTFNLTVESAREVLGHSGRSIEQRAFRTLLRNRVQHGGILAPGASLIKNGENGKGIGSRWYPETLATRITNIAANRDRISFVNGDAFTAIKELANSQDAVFFIDPPYTVAGRRLYKHAVVNHLALFDAMSRVAGRFLMTYDDTPEVRGWADRFNYEVRTVAMRGRLHTTKTELLISRDLSWAQ